MEILVRKVNPYKDIAIKLDGGTIIKLGFLNEDEVDELIGVFQNAISELEE